MKQVSQQMIRNPQVSIPMGPNRSGQPYEDFKKFILHGLKCVYEFLISIPNYLLQIALRTQKLRNAWCRLLMK